MLLYVVPLAVVLATAGGCGSFAAQGKNAEGVRLFQQARYDDALRLFQQAVYDDPTNADGYYNLAATYHRLGKATGRQGDLDQAEHFYNQCLDLDRQGNHRDCYRGLAVLLADEGRHDEAYRLLEGWVDRQPGAADPKIELARLNDEYGDKTKARAQLTEALTIEPDNPRALAALGKLREDMGERSQALAAYQRSLARDNRQPELASRVASLQATVSPPPTSAAPGAPASSTGTRWVEQSSSTWR